MSSRDWDEVGLVARQDFTEFVRNRRAMRSLLRMPLIIIGVGALTFAVSFFSQGGRAGDIRQGLESVSTRGPTTAVPLTDRSLGRTAAVEGIRENHAVVAALEATGFDVVMSDDAAAAASEGEADVSLVVAAPRASQASRIAGVEVTVDDGDQGRQDAAIVSAALDQYALAETRTRIAEAGLAEELTAPIDVEVSARRRTVDRGGSARAAGAVGMFALFPLFSMIGTASERISGARDRRVIEPLLVLPLRRSNILLGKAVSALGIGLLSVVIPFGPLLAIAAVPAVASGLTTLWWRAAGALAVGLGATCLMFVSFGLLSGARARSGGSTTLTNRSVFLLTPFTVIAASAVSNLSWAVPTLLAVPVVGTVLFMQSTLASGPDLLHTVMLLASGMVTSAVLIALASRALTGDMVILRSID